MQSSMQNYAYFAFLLEKGSKKFILCRLLDKSMNFVYLQKTKILILHLVAIKIIFYLATKFRNIMNDLQTQFEHSIFNSG